MNMRSKVPINQHYTKICCFGYVKIDDVYSKIWFVSFKLILFLIVFVWSKNEWNDF